MIASLPRPWNALMQRTIELQVIALPTVYPSTCQTLVINLLRRVEPDDLAPIELPKELDLSQGILLFGSGPNWLYAHLITRCHAAPWIATYHLRSRQGIVVKSRTSAFSPGDTITIQPTTQINPAILIGGPPNSGKSVLSHALNQAILQAQPQLKTHLFRTNWDGEGNHTYETRDRARVEQLRQENNPKLQHQPNSAQKIAQFFQNRAQEIPNIRQMIDLTLVDIGGKTERDRLPVVQACTHYIVISNDPQKVSEWRDLCEPYLQPLVVIHSVLEARLEVLQTEPFLEVVAGPWERGQNCVVPEVVIDRVLSVLGQATKLKGE
jgi:CRISPR-associated protein Csx3